MMPLCWGGWLGFMWNINTTERACINPYACYDFPFGFINFVKSFTAFLQSQF